MMTNHQETQCNSFVSLRERCLPSANRLDDIKKLEDDASERVGCFTAQHYRILLGQQEFYSCLRKYNQRACPKILVSLLTLLDNFIGSCQPDNGLNEQSLLVLSFAEPLGSDIGTEVV